MTPEQKNRLFILFTGHAAETQTADEHAELQHALRHDAEARRLWFVHQDVESGIQSRSAVQTAFVSTKRAKVSAWRQRRPLAAAAAAAAAVFLIGLGVAFWSVSSSGGAVARVVAAYDARLVGVEGDLSAGRKLQLKRLRLETGRLEVTLASGVRLEMIAPLEGEFSHDMRLRLDSGSVNADVGEHGKGFTIETAAGEIVDLGTEFGVQADRLGESRVAVFSGSVEVHSREPRMGGGPVTLTEGMAARFSVQSGLRSWREVALAAREAGLASAHYTGIVERVRDNLGDDELQPFYGVVRRGMDPGMLAFTDKPNPRWAPRPGDKVPSFLLGADLIRTYHQFRYRKAYELTLSLRETAEVYVLINAQSQLPEWLAEKFTNTGESLIAGPFQGSIADWPGAIIGADSLPYFEFAIWKANAPPGEFTLGAAGSAENQFMYGIAIKPKNHSTP